MLTFNWGEKVEKCKRKHCECQAPQDPAVWTPSLLYWEEAALWAVDSKRINQTFQFSTNT